MWLLQLAAWPAHAEYVAFLIKCVPLLDKAHFGSMSHRLGEQEGLCCWLCVAVCTLVRALIMVLEHLLLERLRQMLEGVRSYCFELLGCSFLQGFYRVLFLRQDESLFFHERGDWFWRGWEQSSIGTSTLVLECLRSLVPMVLAGPAFFLLGEALAWFCTIYLVAWICLFGDWMRGDWGLAWLLELRGLSRGMDAVFLGNLIEFICFPSSCWYCRVLSRWFVVLPSRILKSLQYLHVLLCQLLDLLQQHCVFGFYLAIRCFALNFPATRFSLILLSSHLLCFFRLPLLLTRFPFALFDLRPTPLIVAIQSLLKLLTLLFIIWFPFFHLLKLVDALRKLILDWICAVKDLLPGKVHIVAYDMALILQVWHLADHVQMSHLLPDIATCCFEDSKKLLEFGSISSLIRECCCLLYWFLFVIAIACVLGNGSVVTVLG